MQLPAFEFLPQVNDSAEIALFKNEIEYYKGFFREVYVMEGFSSGKTVSHPLLSKANALYRKRCYCKSRGDAVMENYCTIPAARPVACIVSVPKALLQLLSN